MIAVDHGKVISKSSIETVNYQWHKVNHRENNMYNDNIKPTELEITRKKKGRKEKVKKTKN